MKFRIGIDLGTTNCALAWTATSDWEGNSQILPIPQSETAHSSVSLPTLPSFLYLPPAPSGNEWIVGRFARSKTSENPGRTVSSAKSWLVHHAADRRAKFLPFGSDEISPDSRVSPVEALAVLLRSLASAWDAANPSAPLRDQEVAITVPASFDPAAQQLTLDAAALAGIQKSVVLLEEPQAAFYAWMEKNGKSLFAIEGETKPNAFVLVVDIGGGTTDLSLFQISPSTENPSLPHLERIAVSDHLLLGGDNLDLALAHHAEKKLLGDGQLPPATFAQLVARCREIKENAFSFPENDAGAPSSWPIAVALPGASLLAGSMKTEISASELSSVLLDGFFPPVGAKESPLLSSAGLREMGLPYAKDPAITRHLAAFLQGRQPVDFVLFNGGVTKSHQARERILENLTRWQNGNAPKVLSNPDPDLAVAAGAARYLHIRAHGDASYIEAGASHAYYLGTSGGKALCILPMGAKPDSPHLASHPALRASLNRPVSFPLYRNAKKKLDVAGSVADLADPNFSELPCMETVLSSPGKSKSNEKIRVKIRTSLRSTGTLQVEVLNEEPGGKKDPPWPLVFALRKPANTRQNQAEKNAPQTPEKSQTYEEDAVSKAFAAMLKLLPPARQRQKLTANLLFSAAETTLKNQKSSWSGGIARSLFDRWIETADCRSSSAETEEAWLQVAGFLLRPGCGLTGDPERVLRLGAILAAAPAHPARAVKIQRWIAARRIAAGLSSLTAESIWAAASNDWPQSSQPSAEIALLAGALESLPSSIRLPVAERIAAAIALSPDQTSFWKALGRLLSRSLFHAGTEQVLPPDSVESIWALLRDVPLAESSRPEASSAWLRAARLTGLRPLDVPKNTRHQISDLLKKWGTNNVRLQVLHDVIPLTSSDQASLLGESPPPGLSLEPI